MKMTDLAKTDASVGSMDIASRTFAIPTPSPRADRNGSGWTPLDKRVLVLPDEAPDKVGNLFMPPSIKDQTKFAMQTGTLVAVGVMAWAEAKHDARQWGVDFRAPQPGDRVRIGKYAGARFDGADGREYLMMNDEDVLGTPVQ